jgi:hypothetical protein
LIHVEVYGLARTLRRQQGVEATIIMDDAQRSPLEVQVNDSNTESTAPAKRIKLEKPIGTDEFSSAPESIVLGYTRVHIN